MGSRGPRQTPAGLQLVHGNPGKRDAAALQRAAQAPTVQSAVLAAPAHLSDHAKKVWRELAPEMARLGLMATIYSHTFEVFCQAVATWRAATLKLKPLTEARLLDETPNGFKQMSAWLMIQRQQASIIKEYSAMFGLDPASLTRMQPGVQMPVQPSLPGMGDDPQQAAAGLHNKASKYLSPVS